MAPKKTNKKKLVQLCESHSQLALMIKTSEGKAEILIKDLNDQLYEYERKIVDECKTFLGIIQ